MQGFNAQSGVTGKKPAIGLVLWWGGEESAVLIRIGAWDKRNFGEGQKVQATQIPHLGRSL